jgi:anti-sigma-K factor RskA
MNTMNKEAHKREDIEALLPWHAAGTLSRRDAQRVEEALQNDRELASQYELVREELSETIRLNETLGAPSARSMERLLAAIDAEAPQRQSSFVPNFAARVAEFLAGFSPRALAWSATAAVLAIVLQAGIITAVVVGDRSAFQTASHGLTDKGEGAFALVRFSPLSTAADITRFLEANKTAVVEGPKAGGLYRLRVVAGEQSKDELARIVRQMQQEKLIISAFPE